MPRQSIGEFLATLRHAHGFTQQEVADKIGVSNRTLSAWERDTSTPDILLLPVLAELYGVTVDEILQGEKRNGEIPTLSNRSERLVLKNRLSTFTTQLYFVVGAFCAALLLTFIGGLYLARIWAVAMFCVGIGGMLAAVGVFLAILKNAESTVDETAEGFKDFLLLIRARVVLALFLVSIFFAVFFAIGFSLWVTTNGFSTIHLSAGVLSAIFLIVAVGLANCGILVRHFFLKRWGHVSKKTSHKRTIFLCAIPLVIAITGMILFSFWFPVKEDVLCENREVAGLRRHLESVVIPEGSLAPAGEWQLSLSFWDMEWHSLTNGMDLDNGFQLSRIYYENEKIIYVRWKNQTSDGTTFVPIGRAVRINGVESIFDRVSGVPYKFTIYNLRYAHELDMQYAPCYVRSLSADIDSKTYDSNNGYRYSVYFFIRKTTYDFSKVSYFAGAAIIGFDLVACLAMLFLEKEKVTVKL